MAGFARVIAGVPVTVVRAGGRAAGRLARFALLLVAVAAAVLALDVLLFGKTRRDQG